MVKGIDVQNILKVLPPEGRTEFAKRLKAEGGVEVTFTVAGKRRKRKHRWASAEGRVVAVRLSDSVYGRIKVLTAKEGLTVSAWCKTSLIRAAGLLPDGKVRFDDF